MLGHLVAIQLLAADWIDPQDQPLAIFALAYGSVRAPEPLKPHSSAQAKSGLTIT
jgi:hypothetical protein